MYNQFKAKFAVNEFLAVRNAIAVNQSVGFVLPRSFPGLTSVVLLHTEIQNTNKTGNALTV